MWHENETELSRKCHVSVVWVAPKGMETEGGGVRREAAAYESRKETADRVGTRPTINSW